MNTIKKNLVWLVTGVTVLSWVFVIIPGTVNAADLTTRKVTLSSSSAAGSSATTTYTFDFSVGTTATIASIKAQACTTASGTCTVPTGFSQSSSTLTSTNFSGSWSVSTATTGELRASATGASSTSSGAAKQIVWGNVQNPTTTNQTFYMRITTYTGADYSTGPTDTGVVAASTASGITLSGTVDETLVFCTGTSITGTDCGTVSGTSISFGTFSSTAATSGTSVMAASTNAIGGYIITVNGSTLTCGGCSGTPTISAMAAATTSSIGSEQFGLNLKDNATPNVGTEVSPSPNGTSLRGQSKSGYEVADNFKFVTGNTVAASDNGGAGSTNAQTFTVSYLVNIGGATEAGTYTSTMTYICTSTF